MPNSDKPWQPFVVVVASDSDLGLRSLESVLESSGYSVIRAIAGEDVIRLALDEKPDALIVDDRTRDRSGIEISRRLRGEPRFDPTTPIILTTSHGSGRAARLEAFAAGIWDVCSHPIDGELMLAKLGTFLAARQSARRTRQEALLDDTTGLYTLHGLRRRAAEVGADAFRRRESLACIAFSPSLEPEARDAEITPPLLEHVASIARLVARRSDVIGHLGGSEFGIIAPATDARGAKVLVDRLQNLIAAAARQGDRVLPGLSIRAGYSATANLAESGLEAVDLLQRAADALRENPAFQPPRGGAATDGEQRAD